MLLLLPHNTPTTNTTQKRNAVSPLENEKKTPKIKNQKMEYEKLKTDLSAVLKEIVSESMEQTNSTINKIEKSVGDLRQELIDFRTSVNLMQTSTDSTRK